MKQHNSSLAEQLQQLRVPQQLKESPGSDFDSHIKEVIYSKLGSVPAKALQEPDLLNVSFTTFYFSESPSNRPRLSHQASIPFLTLSCSTRRSTRHLQNPLNQRT